MPSKIDFRISHSTTFVQLFEQKDSLAPKTFYGKNLKVQAEKEI